MLNALDAWPLVAVPVGIVGLGFVSYVWHRANHRVSFLWRFHQAHHSDSQFTVTTALRFHPGELLLALPVRLLAVVVLGVPVASVIVFEVVFAFASFVEHGNIDLPRRVERALGRVLITPALHRRHPASRRDGSTRTTGRSSRSGTGSCGPSETGGRT
jgi:sterol desaturase/sphingolipid hydroxylase (fatty acid hydroxylase superfamily)